MNLEIGSFVEGRIVDIVKFGVFVKIKGEKTGLVHISQISDEFVRNISDYVTVGSDIVAKVISIDDKGRVQLSMKDVPPEKAAQFKKSVEEKNPSSSSQPISETPFYRNKNAPPKEENFESKMKKFLRQSEDRLIDLKRSTESKRSGGKRKR